MLAICLFTAFLVIRAAPDTFLGRALRRGLVEWPAERLSQLTRGQLVCWLGAGLLLWAALAVLGGDALQALGMAVPDTVAWFAVFDISTMVDVLVAAAIVLGQAGLRSVAQRLRTLPGAARRVSARRRAPRRRRRRAAPKPDNDDEGRPAFALAA